MMDECRNLYAQCLLGGEQVGQEVFHAASKGWVELANMEDAHGWCPLVEGWCSIQTDI
jgi:hypothetical protein